MAQLEALWDNLSAFPLSLVNSRGKLSCCNPKITFAAYIVLTTASEIPTQLKCYDIQSKAISCNNAFGFTNTTPGYFIKYTFEKQEPISELSLNYLSNKGLNYIFLQKAFQGSLNQGLFNPMLNIQTVPSSTTLCWALEVGKRVASQPSMLGQQLPQSL